MPTGSDVRVTFTGDTSQLTAASKQASAAIASTGDAADKAQSKMDALNEEASRVGDGFGKVGGSASKAAGAVGMLSPAAGDAIGSLADLADVGEMAAEASAALGVSAAAVTAALGALVTAAALVAAAYAGWNEEAATATRLTEQQNALTAAMAPLYEDTEAAIRAARVELGLMTEAQAEMIDAGLAGLAQYQEATEATRKRLAELRASQASMTGQVQQFLGDVGEALPLQEYNVLAQVIDAATTSSSEFATEEGRLQEGLSGAAAELKRNREAHAALTAAKSKGKAATDGMTAADEAAEAAAKAREAAERRLAEFLAERAKAEKDYADALASIRAMESEANADRLTEIEALTAARDEQIATLNRTLTEQLAATEGNAIRQAEIEQAGADARLAIEQRYQRDKGEIVAESNARIAEENAAALADLEAQNRAAAEAIYQVSGDLFGSVSDLAGSLMDAGLAKSKEGLRALFGVQQAAAVAQAAINTALAVSNALALPLPPPLPQIAAVAAGIAGAAQVAAITSTPPPSFRSGYMPDQQLAYFEPQSEIVAPASAVQAMGGKDAAREVFAGMSGGSAPTVTRFTMGHREFSALVQGSATRPGALRDLTVRPSTRYDPHHRR
ncbi:MAG: hypothetical protein KJT01_01075 [Gemmatimonadetes bacterium]|nr:hypothetical protein [Gemmatimonadota bacterium]